MQDIWNQMQHTMGPCQLWATCDEHNRFAVAFLSTSLEAWLDYAFHCEDIVLLGFLSCMAKGRKEYFKAVRVGKCLPCGLHVAAEALNAIPFEQIFQEHVDEIEIHPNDNKENVKSKLCEALNCDARYLQV